MNESFHVHNHNKLLEVRFGRSSTGRALRCNLPNSAAIPNAKSGEGERFAGHICLLNGQDNPRPAQYEQPAPCR